MVWWCVFFLSSPHFIQFMPVETFCTPAPLLSISPPTSHSSFPLRNKGMPDVELSNRLAISTTGVRHMRGSLFFLRPVRVCLCRHLNVCVGSAWLCDGFFVLAETIWSQSCTTALHTPTQKRAHTHTYSFPASFASARRLNILSDRYLLLP